MLTHWFYLYIRGFFQRSCLLCSEVALSSPNPASERSVVAAAFAAIALFVVTWTLLHVGFYKHKQLIDTPVYQRYGDAIADGRFPTAI